MRGMDFLHPNPFLSPKSKSKPTLRVQNKTHNIFLLYYEGPRRWVMLCLDIHNFHYIIEQLADGLFPKKEGGSKKL
jgi:hypothetical protein